MLSPDPQGSPSTTRIRFLKKRSSTPPACSSSSPFVEERFGIEVNDDELIPDNFDSVNKLNEYVKKKKGA